MGCAKHGGSKCVSCSAGYWLSGEACQKHTDCDALGRVQKTAGTGTTDAVCGPRKKCTCRGGEGTAGTECPQHGAAKCSSCLHGFWLSNAACKKRTNCAEAGRVQRSPGSPSTDAVCGGFKQCTCSNGTGTTGVDCPQDNAAACAQCDQGFFLDGRRCDAWTDCKKQGKLQKSPGTATMDAVCESECPEVPGGSCKACLSANMCSIVVCAASYFNLNGNAADGCEATCHDIITLEHGTCRNCSSTGKCTVLDCNDGFTDANNQPEDGCEAESDKISLPVVRDSIEKNWDQGVTDDVVIPVVIVVSVTSGVVVTSFVFWIISKLRLKKKEPKMELDGLGNRSVISECVL